LEVQDALLDGHIWALPEGHTSDYEQKSDVVRDGRILGHSLGDTHFSYYKQPFPACFLGVPRSFASLAFSFGVSASLADHNCFQLWKEQDSWDPTKEPCIYLSGQRKVPKFSEKPTSCFPGVGGELLLPDTQRPLLCQ
jgi:hypothetical protein